MPITTYCGGDFHARQQTDAYCDTADGGVRLNELDHDGADARGVDSSLTGGVIAGIEAGGYST